MKRKKYTAPQTQEYKIETTTVLMTSPVGRPDTTSIWEP